MLIGNQINNFLKRVNIKHIYGMPADSVNGLYDYLSYCDNICTHQVYNEKVGASAALCTPLLSPTASAVVATAGPGIGHLKQAMFYAQNNKTPVVFFVGLPDSGAEQYSFQDIQIDKFSNSLGMPFFDVRTNISTLDNVTHADLPCVVGVDKAMFMDTRYIDIGEIGAVSHGDKKNDREHELSSDSLCLSESLIHVDSKHPSSSSDTVAYANTISRPSGWGAGLVVALAALKLKGYKCFLHEKDFFEGISDLFYFLGETTIDLTVFCDQDSEVEHLENIFDVPNLSSEIKMTSSVTFANISQMPDDIRVVKNTANVRVYKEETEIDLECSTVEAISLAGAAFARLGYKVVFEADTIFDLLALSNGIYDIFMDEVKAEVKIKLHQTEDDFKHFFPALNPLYPQLPQRDVTSDLFEEFNQKLSASKKPVFVLGSHSVKYADEIIDLSTKYRIPIATTMGAFSSYKHAPYFIGMIGSAGSFQAEKIRSSSDMLIYIGVTNRGVAHGVFYCNSSCWDINSSLDILNSRPEKNKQINVELDEFIRHFNPKNTIRHQSWIEKIDRAQRHVLRPGKYASEVFSGRKISSRSAIREALLNFSPEETLIFVDVGIHTLWAARTIPAAYDVVWTRNFATMGIAAVSGLKTAKYVDKNILVITGDGGFGLILGEVLSGAVDVAKTLNIMIINNGGLGAVRYEQEVCGWKANSYAYPLLGSEWLKRLSGKPFQTLSRKEDLPILSNLFKKNKFNIINLLVDPYEAPVPSRDVDTTARLRMLKVWAKSGFTGFHTALRTVPYIIDKWEAR